jgi:alkaline phosphatase
MVSLPRWKMGASCRFRSTLERVARVFRKRLALGSCLLLAAVAPQPGAALSRNVIFFIGDGMGFEQVKAARYYNDGPLTFEDLPHQGQVTTHSADSSITDSGAAATAMATGTKVDNRVISVADPGDGSELETVLEICRDLDMSTGLVTTTQMTHATPAAFGAHEPSRDNRDAIADDYLSQTRPNLLLGGGTHMSESAAMAAGYTVVTD